MSNIKLKRSGDMRADLIATSTSFAELARHNVKLGLVKNTVLLLMAVTAMSTAGWWGALLALLALLAMVWSATGWVRVLSRSPMVTPGSAPQRVQASRGNSGTSSLR
jgi:hypothetical protein